MQPNGYGGTMNQQELTECDHIVGYSEGLKGGDDLEYASFSHESEYKFAYCPKCGEKL
jgi:hypothetical protein